MKPRISSVRISRRVAFSCGIATICLMSPQVARAGQRQEPSAEVPAEPEAAEASEEEDAGENALDLIVGAVITDGDDAAAQRRLGSNGDFYGGIESLRWGGDVGEDLSLLVEGRAIFGNEDYGLSGTLTKQDIGYVSAGFEQFRTWYDGSGGYMPGAATPWYPLFGDELDLDRGSVWFEAGLRKEDFPEITFRYEHDWRDGQKDSTIWGRNESGFGILPTLNDIDESRDTFTLDIAHTLGITDLGLGLRYESGSADNTRTMRQGGPNAVLATDDRTVTNTESYDYDLFNAHAFSTTRFNERFLMSFGYSYTSMDTDIGGDRAPYSRDGVLRTSQDHALFGLKGGGQSSLNVVNANLWWNPVDDLVIVPSFRAEFLDQDALGWHVAGVRNATDATQQEVDDAINGVGWPAGGYLEEVRDKSDYELNEFTEALEVRYNGLSDLVLYAGAEFTQMEGDMWRSTMTNRHDGVTPVENGARWTDSDLDRQKYSVGANWYPLRNLNFGAKYCHRATEVDYDNTFDPAFGAPFDALVESMESTTDDLGIRMTWRAMPNLTLVSRYDYCQTTIENRGYDPTGLPLRMVESADIEQHVFSQSATWMPLSRMYLQGSVNYVLAETDTKADYYAPGLVTDMQNDYVVASLTCGYALDKKTDIQATYSYFYSDNYDIPFTAGVPGSVGYGTDLEEHFFSIALNRRIAPNMVWNLGYGFFMSNDGTSGGYNDFDSHIVTTGFHLRY